MRASGSTLVQVTGSNLTYVYIVLGISLAALAIAAALRSQILAKADGTDKMREIAQAVQEGAAAYLARQFRTLSFFVGIVFVLLFALPGSTEIKVGRSIFFLVGAAFSAIVAIKACGWQFAQTCALQKPHVKSPQKAQCRLHSAPEASSVC